MKLNLKLLAIAAVVVVISTGLIFTTMNKPATEETGNNSQTVTEGLATDENVESPMLTLADINTENFYPTSKVAYIIEGKMVSQPESVTNILEGTDYTAQPNTDVILKGTVEELWVTPLEKVLKTYIKEDGSELTPEDFKTDEFISLYTKPGNACFAAFVPVGTQVKINTAWGDVLIANRPEVEHGLGDYIVCRAGEDGKPDFSDVWVVNGKVFETTYDMSQIEFNK